MAANSSKTLNKTLQEWEIDGSGEGGVDAVSYRDRRFALELFVTSPLGLRNDRFRNGNRQERRSVRVSHFAFREHVLIGLDTSFTMIFRRVWKVSECAKRGSL